MKKLVNRAAVATLVCGLVAMVFMAGCEDVQQNKDITITVSPDRNSVVDQLTISGPVAVTCVASLTSPMGGSSNAITTLFLPLEWWVRDTSLGSIVSSEGYSAVYVSSGNAGANTISVKDQRGISGTIGITQSAVVESAAATP